MSLHVHSEYSLTAAEQRVMDAIIKVMDEIRDLYDDRNPRNFVEEGIPAIHVLQSFVRQHWAHRIAPEIWDDWIEYKSPKSRLRIGREAANKKRSQFMKTKYEKDPTSNPLYGKSPKNYRGWGCGQFVEGLGFWVRSTWKRDYLLALKDAKIVFEYEAKRFDLEGKGTYCPDVRLNDEDIYVEITGWDKPEKVKKRAMFKEIYGYPLYVWDQKPTTGHISDFVEMCKGVIQRDESTCTQ